MAIVFGKDFPFEFDSVLNQTVNIAKKTLEEVLKEIAQATLVKAQERIIFGAFNEDFTQKHYASLANYITLKEETHRNGSKSYAIVAGEDAPQEIKYELYYAEYGAGLTAEKSAKPSSYVEKGKINSTGFWFYNELDGSSSYVDRSIPLRYMREAKEFAKNQIKEKIVKEFKTTVKKAFRTSIKRG